MERNNIIEYRTQNFLSRKNCNENWPQHYQFVLFNPQSAGNHGFSENLLNGSMSRDPLNYTTPDTTAFAK